MEVVYRDVVWGLKVKSVMKVCLDCDFCIYSIFLNYKFCFILLLNIFYIM